MAGRCLGAMFSLFTLLQKITVAGVTPLLPCNSSIVYYFIIGGAIVYIILMFVYCNLYQL